MHILFQKFQREGSVPKGVPSPIYFIVKDRGEEREDNEMVQQWVEARLKGPSVIREVPSNRNDVTQVSGSDYSYGVNFDTGNGLLGSASNHLDASYSRLNNTTGSDNFGLGRDARLHHATKERLCTELQGTRKSWTFATADMYSRGQHYENPENGSYGNEQGNRMSSTGFGNTSVTTANLTNPKRSAKVDDTIPGEMTTAVSLCNIKYRCGSSGKLQVYVHMSMLT